MSAVDTRVEASVPPARPGSGRSFGWWGTVMMIATEAMLFALLLYAYLQLRIEAHRWPLGDIADPELVKSGFRTVVLLASSVPVHLADRAAEAGQATKLRWCLAIGWLMGALFLLGHVEEWHTLWQEFTPTTNTYGSLFYTITGFHALHLVVGLVVIGLLWFGAVTDRHQDGDADAVHNGVLYWHFVDVIWVSVYGLLYLSVTLT